ncbi:IDEAL domain-containing protein [Virgibacillus natechei]|uniref:IDEAL domain-containing protein n=1 Tax=Virgibacillus sp. CBA3643 TaxID=2942278 RepID=UPI0035A387BA
MVVTVKKLKPYHIKADSTNLYVIVSPSYFTVVINNEEYQFVPMKAREIIVNRRTKLIDNLEDEFAFQKGENVIYITMSELILMPDFVILVDSIAAPFYIKNTEQINEENNVIIEKIERLNVIRLIDKALDERDENAFYALLKLL